MAAGEYSAVLTPIRVAVCGKPKLGFLDELWNDKLGLEKEDLDTAVKRAWGA
jgi:hypothetical protein